MDQPLQGSSGGETSSAPEPNTSGASRVEGGPKIDQEFLEKRRAQCGFLSMALGGHSNTNLPGSQMLRS